MNKQLLEQKQIEEDQQNKESEKAITELQERYTAALQEIKDLEEEHENQHAELLNTVREQEHEIRLLNGMLKMLLNDNEIAKIRMRSQFDDDKDEWDIPYFYLKAKEVELPKLSNKNKDLIENEKLNRDVEFGESKQFLDTNQLSKNHPNVKSQQMLNGSKVFNTQESNGDMYSRQSRASSRRLSASSMHKQNDFENYNHHVPKHIENNFGSEMLSSPTRTQK